MTAGRAYHALTLVMLVATVAVLLLLNGALR